MSDEDENDTLNKKKIASNHELRSLRSEKLASLSKSYSDIYKKYGYPTFKFSRKSSKLTLSELDESDYFDESNIDGEKSETSLPLNLLSSYARQPVVPTVNQLWAESQEDESNSMIVGKSIFLKKNKKKRVTICTTHCRYSSVRRVAAMLGMREVLENDQWSFMWMDSSITVDRVKHMKRFQRINHFPGMMEICRKDLLARNLNRMRKTFPNDYNFFPHSWSLPTELNEALKYNKRNRSKTFILKPECSSQGKGIFLVKNLKDLSKVTERFICQQYLSKPYTIDGFKFDIRIYTLISSCDPLRMYVYNEGLVRFATQRYAIPDCKNATNHFIHLTNFSINRRSANFVHDQDKGSKRKISTVNSMLASRGIDVDRMWLEIDKCIVKTVIAGWPMIRHNYKACFPTHDTMSACFELLGFDILLDYKLRPFILEVNHSPSFHTETPIDCEVKESLLFDTFQLLNVWGWDSRKIIDEDRKRTRERLCLGKGSSKVSIDTEASSSSVFKYTSQDTWELAHLGNFRRVYPSNTVDYEPFFNQQAGSLYTTTESIRRKAESAKQLRNDLAETKAKIENQKKAPFNLLISDTSQSSKAHSVKENNYENDSSPTKKGEHAEMRNIPLIEMFEPMPIVEIDDRKRSMFMENRANLLRTYGITRQVYKLMKANGTLRENDIRKYGVFDKTVKLSSLQSNTATMFDINNNNNNSITSVKCLSTNKLSTNESNISNSLDSSKKRKMTWAEFDKQMAEYSERLNMLKQPASKYLKPIAEVDDTLKDNLIVKTLLDSTRDRDHCQ